MATTGVDPEDVDCWTDEQPCADLLDGLRTLLPRNTSWPGGAVEEFRANLQGGSYIRIWREEKEGPIRSIQFMFSSMGDDRVVLDRLVALCVRHEVALYSSGTSRWLEPSLRALRIDLRATPKFKIFWERDWSVAVDGSSMERRMVE